LPRSLAGFAVPVLLSALLLACTSARKQPAQSAAGGEPKAPWLEDRAAEATAELFDAFNSDCHRLFKKAVPGLRLQPSQDWVSQCTVVQTRLGRWSTFHIGSSRVLVASPGIATFVETTATAVFAKSTFGARAVWDVTSDTPSLVLLQFGEGAEMIFPLAPRLSPEGPRLIDPPPHRSELRS